MKLTGVFFFFFKTMKKKKQERLPVRTDLTVTFFAYSEQKKPKYTPRKASLSYSLTRKVRSIDRSFLTR